MTKMYVLAFPLPGRGAAPCVFAATPLGWGFRVSGFWFLVWGFCTFE